VLIASSVAHLGADGQPHYMSDHSLFVTFWTGAAIMLVAFFIAFYFGGTFRQDSRDFQD
jgi:heme/copper-type cytochrome/quinol oxidase subunit 2